MAALTQEIRDKLVKIKLLIVDCDGVLTDGRIVLLSESEETKFFDVKDGHGIRMAARDAPWIGQCSAASVFSASVALLGIAT